MQKYNDITNIDLLSNKRIKYEIVSINNYIQYQTSTKLNITDYCIDRENLYFEIIDKNKINFSVIYKDKCSIYFTMKLQQEYPFRPPTVHFRTKNYNEILCNLNIYINNFKSHGDKNQKCLCCNTLTCRSNWGPQLKIIDVIEEIYGIYQLINTYIENIDNFI